MRRLVTLSLLSGALLLGACGNAAEVAALDGRLASLEKSVKEQDLARTGLLDRLNRTERAVRGLQEDLASMRSAGFMAGAPVARAGRDDPAAAPGDTDGTDGMDGEGTAGAESTPDAEAVREFLTTDEGRDLIEKVQADLQRKRDEQRWNDMASRMVDRFAEEANLTEDQAERMRDVSARSMSKIRDVWMNMRDVAAELPDEERAAAREDAMAKMQEIRTETDDEVKLILDSSQFELYQEQTSRMGGFGGRGARGGGGFGGRR